MEICNLYCSIVFIYLITFLPSLAVSLRRLHDVNKTGKWILLLFVPILNFLITIAFIIWTLSPGTDGANNYGDDLKKV